MPHLVLTGHMDMEAALAGFSPEVHRWGRVVLKTAECWLRRDRRALLIEGVVVEYARPLHPIVQVALNDASITVRLWPPVDVERTPAVQRLLGLVAAQLQQSGAGEVCTTNIPGEHLDGIALKTASPP